MANKDREREHPLYAVVLDRLERNAVALSNLGRKKGLLEAKVAKLEEGAETLRTNLCEVSDDRNRLAKELAECEETADGGEPTLREAIVARLDERDEAREKRDAAQNRLGEIRALLDVDTWNGIVPAIEALQAKAAEVPS